ncbi:MAG TPA: translation initiation factor IF-3 [Streptosporangiaceae bacterium]|nr:translation initiation factor IF-3 [Streptosporangiaceae bacterium]
MGRRVATQRGRCYLRRGRRARGGPAMRAVRGAAGFLLYGELRESPGPGPTRFLERGDIGGHISTEPRINDRIRVPEVRLVGPSGEQVGIVSITDALRLAQEADLDLVEVAPTARPPVCKLMDFGKFKYESALKARESRKNQAQTVIKEIKIRPKIDPHDYGTKKGHVERFLRQGDKVKVTIMFRGREQSRPELGYKLLQRLAGDVEELGFVESQPKQDGRNMIMVIGPHRKKADAKAARGPDRASARAAAPTASQDRAASSRPAAQVRPASRPAPASQESASPSPGPRPEPTRTGAAGGQQGAGSATGTGQAAPSPAPRPGPPRPGPASTAGPAAPKPGPRPAAPRPSAPRPPAAKPADPRPVPTPRARSAQGAAAQPTSAEQRAAGAEAGG